MSGFSGVARTLPRVLDQKPNVKGKLTPCDAVCQNIADGWQHEAMRNSRTDAHRPVRWLPPDDNTAHSMSRGRLGDPKRG